MFKLIATILFAQILLAAPLPQERELYHVERINAIVPDSTDPAGSPVILPLPNGVTRNTPVIYGGYDGQ